MNVAMQECLRAAGAVFDESDRVSVRHFGDSAAEYEAIAGGAAIIDVSDRTAIELTGADRHSFLHNLCTNEIRGLPAGAGCEAFLCSVQGKILFYVNVFAGKDSLLLDTVPGQSESLIAHLDRYLIREEVKLTDRTRDRGALLLAGAKTESSLAQLASGLMPEKLLAGCEFQVESRLVSARRVDWIGESGFLLTCPADETPLLWQALIAGGAKPCGDAAMDVARIETGTPQYGRDISEANLPQEVARDTRTISFTKGCYLGQETVARIDALGHVNRLLVGVRFGGDEVPPGGSEILTGDKKVGTVTSATFSYRLGTPLALAYLRREKCEPGTRLESSLGHAEVVTLPI